MNVNTTYPGTAPFLFRGRVGEGVSSFDAYGRRRDKDTWSYTIDDTNALFADRGFTGHEHLTQFGLINMNGRLYDPLVGRFLSPDNYVQDASSTQNFNRYGYCLNNPLRYTDPSGDFIPIWVIPNIGWSKAGGLSLGISVVAGVPGGVSAQIGGGYSFKSGEAYGYAGVTYAFNTVSLSYSSGSKWSASYTVGASIYSGLPISTNFATAGVNYNISYNSWSGNVSAWSVDQSGWSFNPSVSVMVCPEQTTNFVRGQGFRSNDAVLSRFVASGNQQGALDYWGFKGTYDPDLALRTAKDYQATDYWGATNTSSGDISFGRLAFDNYATLSGTYMKELYTSRNILRHNYHELPSNVKGLGINTYLEEVNGYVYAYKNQGLFLGNKLPWQGIKTYQGGLNAFDIASPTYPNKFNWLYKIPRKW